MTETYKKIDDNTLEITRNNTSIHIFTIEKAEIETELFHLKVNRDKMEKDFQNKIIVLKSKLAILDKEE